MVTAPARAKAARTVVHFTGEVMRQRLYDGWSSDQADQLVRLGLATARQARFLETWRGLSADQRAVLATVSGEALRYAEGALRYCLVASRLDGWRQSRAELLARTDLPQSVLALLLDAHNDALPRVHAAEADRAAARGGEPIRAGGSGNSRKGKL